ncbi:MAG: substrate-binding domain-containing protein [Candidatus Bathyarchaeota archaeon]|nr:substrate-binding domain-containing protein [Candidatus Bathyarchaeota archaeon]
MKTWQKLLAAAVLATIVVIAGTIAYFELSPKRRLIISVTTSLYDTGLLELLEKDYETKHTDIDINIIAAGTGIAIQHAKNGDADLILVHAPAQELTFLEQGWGLNRKIIAYNYFTIVGPENDPARIEGKATNQALRAIANYGGNLTDQSGQTKIWISRGDNSGTHSKEQALWKAAGYNYTEISTQPWYANVGQGMGATLTVADQKNAYTLSDIGTFLKFEKDNSISLTALLTEEKSLLNVYSVMAVNQTVPANQTIHDKINYVDAMDFIKYLVSSETQQFIENYGKADYGQSLFYGAVQPLKDNAPQPIVSWIQSAAFFNGTECPQQYRNGYPELYT